MQRPQKRGRGNQLIHRRLSRTKSIGSGSDPKSQGGQTVRRLDGVWRWDREGVRGRGQKPLLWTKHGAWAYSWVLCQVRRVVERCVRRIQVRLLERKHFWLSIGNHLPMLMVSIINHLAYPYFSLSWRCTRRNFGQLITSLGFICALDNSKRVTNYLTGVTSFTIGY